jgi:hypothetical protein
MSVVEIIKVREIWMRGVDQVGEWGASQSLAKTVEVKVPRWPWQCSK